VSEHEEFEGVPQPGEVILDKYRVDKVLGAGGMGVVVAATHLGLNQQVAIKFLLAKAARNPKAVQRFTREAQAAARIQSDYVTKVSDVGTLASGAPYMVMEHLDGEDLGEVLERGAALPVPQAVTYLLQACEALAEAHKAGIVHRDLKPANLFLARRADGTSRVKVLDFGISKILIDPSKGDADHLTRTSTLMGSPLYMSPEQMISAKHADHRTDIWALGVILYELVSGHSPFLAGTLPEICSRIMAAPHDPLQGVAPHVPPGLVQVIDTCLVKKPEERCPNLAVLATALVPFGDHDAKRHADTICRVLGDGAIPPPMASAPSGPGAAGPAATGPGTTGPGVTGPGVTGPGVTGPGVTGPGGYPPAGAHGSVPQAAGVSGSVSGNISGPEAPSPYDTGGQAGAAVQAVTAGSHPGNTTGNHAVITSPQGPAMPQAATISASDHDAMMQLGGSTAMPVSHTMDEPAPKKSRAGLILGIVGIVVVLGAGAALALSSMGPDGSSQTATTAPAGDTAAAVDTAAASETTEAVEAPAHSAEVEVHAEAEASASASAKATTASKATAASPPPRRLEDRIRKRVDKRLNKHGITPPPPPPPPPPPRTGRAGDELFDR
jgi:serine/threonine-protein kinase